MYKHPWEGPYNMQPLESELTSPSRAFHKMSLFVAAFRARACPGVWQLSGGLTMIQAWFLPDRQTEERAYRARWTRTQEAGSRCEQ